jgi:stage V sporulation protein G
MEITEVRIKLMEESEDRLRGFCSITFDNCFVVRDLKIIQGNNGPFVAMPSRKLTGNCRKCNTKNHLKANYCNNCGERLVNQQIMFDSTGRAKLYADIAHPVNARCREMIQRRIVEELRREIELAAQPGYKSRYDDDYDEDFDLADYAEGSNLRASGKTPTSVEPVERKKTSDSLTQSPSDSPAESADEQRSTERHDPPQLIQPTPHEPPQIHPNGESAEESGKEGDPPPGNFGQGIF